MKRAKTISREQTQEALSEAYVRAIAVMAECLVSRPEKDLFGYDVEVTGDAGLEFPCFRIQLKATTKLGILKSGERVFRDLDVRSYNILRKFGTVGTILMVLDLPRDNKRWVDASAYRLIIERCAYWTCLQGAPETNNKATVSVRFPRDSLFTANAVTALLEKARLGPDLR